MESSIWELPKLRKLIPKYIYCYDDSDPWSLVQLRQPQRVLCFRYFFEMDQSLQKMRSQNKMEEEIDNKDQKNKQKMNEDFMSEGQQIGKKQRENININTFFILFSDQDRQRIKEFKRNIYIMIKQADNYIVRRNIYDLFEKAVNSSIKNINIGPIFQKLYNFNTKQQEIATVFQLYQFSPPFSKILNFFLKYETQANQLFWVQPFVKIMYEEIKNRQINHKKVVQAYRRQHFSERQFQNLLNKYQCLEQGQHIFIESMGFWRCFIKQNKAGQQPGTFLLIININGQQPDISFNNGYIQLNEGQQILLNIFNIFMVDKIYQSNQIHQNIGIKYCIQLKYVNSNKFNVNLQQDIFEEQHKNIYQHNQFQIYTQNCIQGLAYGSTQSEAGYQYFKRMTIILRQNFKKNHTQKEIRSNCQNLIKRYQQLTKKNNKQQQCRPKRSEQQIEQIIESRDFIKNPLKYPAKQFIIFVIRTGLPLLQKLKITQILRLIKQTTFNYRQAIQKTSIKFSKYQQQWQHEIMCILNVIGWILGEKTQIDISIQIIREIMKINFKQLYQHQHIAMKMKMQIYQIMDKMTNTSVNYQAKLLETQQFKLVKQIVTQYTHKQNNINAMVDAEEQQLSIIKKSKQLIRNLPKLYINLSRKLRPTKQDRQLSQLIKKTKKIIGNLPIFNQLKILIQNPIIVYIIKSFASIKIPIKKWSDLYQTVVLSDLQVSEANVVRAPVIEEQKMNKQKQKQE